MRSGCDAVATRRVAQGQGTSDARELAGPEFCTRTGIGFRRKVDDAPEASGITRIRVEATDASNEQTEAVGVDHDVVRDDEHRGAPTRVEDLDDCARAGCGIYRDLDRGLRIHIDRVGIGAEIAVGDLDRYAELDCHIAVLLGEHRSQTVGFGDGLANSG
ncbi:Uncharacterised protein [Mycobacteroides abscessus subsp. abscessus]|nr:Uncharacterised protein [Mycobacteroides abscessus subsp. abscessus]